MKVMIINEYNVNNLSNTENIS